MSGWSAIAQVREALPYAGQFGPRENLDRATRADAALSVVEEALEAAAGVMTQMDYETPHHTRLRAALARAREGIKP